VKRREIEKNDEKWKRKWTNRKIPPIFEWQVVENEEAIGKRKPRFVIRGGCAFS